MYDPSVAVSKATSSLLAMTALDTTNLRLTFTAPASGNVMVRMRCSQLGATTFPRILLGVLDGATVRLRMAPQGQLELAVAANRAVQEVYGVVTGLTPGNSYTWDAAYGVEDIVASTNIQYGGPNDASGADAYGGFLFEIWECANLLAGTLYDPATAVTKSGTSLRAMTAFDTTNLRLTVTAPSNGLILWRVHAQHHGGATPAQVLLGLLEGAAVVARSGPLQGNPAGNVSTATFAQEASGILTGVSAGNHTYDAAFAIQVVANGGGLKYGGPNDAVSDNAFGGLAFELWSA